MSNKSLYLTTFSLPFGKYRYVCLPFCTGLAGYKFQRKIAKLFQGLPNMFGIVDYIIIAGLNDMVRYHNATLNKVLRICRQANLKLNKDKFLFWCTGISFFDEVIS